MVYPTSNRHSASPTDLDYKERSQKAKIPLQNLIDAFKTIVPENTPAAKTIQKDLVTAVLSAKNGEPSPQKTEKAIKSITQLWETAMKKIPQTWRTDMKWTTQFMAAAITYNQALSHLENASHPQSSTLHCPLYEGEKVVILAMQQLADAEKKMEKLGKPVNFTTYLIARVFEGKSGKEAEKKINKIWQEALLKLTRQQTTKAGELSLQKGIGALQRAPYFHSPKYTIGVSRSFAPLYSYIQYENRLLTATLQLLTDCKLDDEDRKNAFKAVLSMGRNSLKTIYMLLNYARIDPNTWQEKSLLLLKLRSVFLGRIRNPVFLQEFEKFTQVIHGSLTKKKELCPLQLCKKPENPAITPSISSLLLQMAAVLSSQETAEQQLNAILQNQPVKKERCIESRKSRLHYLFMSPRYSLTGDSLKELKDSLFIKTLSSKHILYALLNLDREAKGLDQKFTDYIAQIKAWQNPEKAGLFQEWKKKAASLIAFRIPLSNQHLSLLPQRIQKEKKAYAAAKKLLHTVKTLEKEIEESLPMPVERILECMLFALNPVSIFQLCCDIASSMTLAIDINTYRTWVKRLDAAKNAYGYSLKKLRLTTQEKIENNKWVEKVINPFTTIHSLLYLGAKISSEFTDDFRPEGERSRLKIWTEDFNNALVLPFSTILKWLKGMKTPSPNLSKPLQIWKNFAATPPQKNAPQEQLWPKKELHKGERRMICAIVKMRKATNSINEHLPLDKKVSFDLRILNAFFDGSVDALQTISSTWTARLQTLAQNEKTQIDETSFQAAVKELGDLPSLPEISLKNNSAQDVQLLADYKAFLFDLFLSILDAINQGNLTTKGYQAALQKILDIRLVFFSSLQYAQDCLNCSAFSKTVMQNEKTRALIQVRIFLGVYLRSSKLLQVLENHTKNLYEGVSLKFHSQNPHFVSLGEKMFIELMALEGMPGHDKSTLKLESLFTRIAQDPMFDEKTSTPESHSENLRQPLKSLPLCTSEKMCKNYITYLACAFLLEPKQIPLGLVEQQIQLQAKQFLPSQCSLHKGLEDKIGSMPTWIQQKAKKFLTAHQEIYQKIESALQMPLYSALYFIANTPLPGSIQQLAFHTSNTGDTYKEVEQAAEAIKSVFLKALEQKKVPKDTTLASSNPKAPVETLKNWIEDVEKPLRFFRKLLFLCSLALRPDLMASTLPPKDSLPNLLLKPEEKQPGDFHSFASSDQKRHILSWLDGMQKIHQLRNEQLSTLGICLRETKFYISPTKNLSLSVDEDKMVQIVKRIRKALKELEKICAQKPGIPVLATVCQMYFTKDPNIKENYADFLKKVCTEYETAFQAKRIENKPSSQFALAKKSYLDAIKEVSLLSSYYEPKQIEVPLPANIHYKEYLKWLFHTYLSIVKIYKENRGKELFMQTLPDLQEVLFLHAKEVRRIFIDTVLEFAVVQQKKVQLLQEFLFRTLSHVKNETLFAEKLTQYVLQEIKRIKECQTKKHPTMEVSFPELSLYYLLHIDYFLMKQKKSVYKDLITKTSAEAFSPRKSQADSELVHHFFKNIYTPFTAGLENYPEGACFNQALFRDVFRKNLSLTNFLPDGALKEIALRDQKIQSKIDFTLLYQAAKNTTRFLLKERATQRDKDDQEIDAMIDVLWTGASTPDEEALEAHFARQISYFKGCSRDISFIRFCLKNYLWHQEEPTASTPFAVPVEEQQKLFDDWIKEKIMQSEQRIDNPEISPTQKLLASFHRQQKVELRYFLAEISRVVLSRFLDPESPFIEKGACEKWLKAWPQTWSDALNPLQEKYVLLVYPKKHDEKESPKPKIPDRQEVDQGIKKALEKKDPVTKYLLTGSIPEK